jgi:hypothetical protein
MAPGTTCNAGQSDNLSMSTAGKRKLRRGTMVRKAESEEDCDE